MLKEHYIAEEVREPCLPSGSQIETTTTLRMYNMCILYVYNIKWIFKCVV